MQKNITWSLIAALAFMFVIFSPKIDQFLALASYNELARVFYGEEALWCKIIYKAVPVITVVLILLPLVWLFKSRHDKKKIKQVTKFGLIVYLSLALGPGLVVNVLLKDHWGRPRPYQVLRDNEQYSPFWVPHFSNNRDNSFPGGHASIGFFLGIPLLALGRKKSAVIVSLGGGVLVGSVRILQGGHYFSDVIFSGIFVWLIAWFVIHSVAKLNWGVTLSE